MMNKVKTMLREHASCWWWFSEVGIDVQGTWYKVDAIVMLHGADVALSQCCLALEFDGSSHFTGGWSVQQGKSDARAQKKDWLTEQGIELVEWKYDVADSVNAHLVIQALDRIVQRVSQ